MKEFYCLSFKNFVCAGSFLRHVGFSLVVAYAGFSFDEQASLPCGMWDLSSLTKIKSAFPALEGRFLTTGPPGKSWRALNTAAMMGLALWKTHSGCKTGRQTLVR